MGLIFLSSIKMCGRRRFLQSIRSLNVLLRDCEVSSVLLHFSSFLHVDVNSVIHMIISLVSDHYTKTCVPKLNLRNVARDHLPCSSQDTEESTKHHSLPVL